MPWALLLCVTKAELIQVSWHFSAYSHLCARSTASEHWLSWRPCTMCCGGCWNKGEPSSSSDTRVGTAAFSKGKMGIFFSPFCASFLPLSQLCHCRTKKFPGTEEETINLSVKCMGCCWGFPAVYALAFFFILAGDSFNVYCINGSPNCLNYIFYYMSPNSTKQSWNSFSCHVMSYSVFQVCCLVYLEKQLVSREWVGGLRKKLFSSKQVYGS